MLFLSPFPYLLLFSLYFSYSLCFALFYPWQAHGFCLSYTMPSFHQIRFHRCFIQKHSAEYFFLLGEKCLNFQTLVSSSTFMIACAKFASCTARLARNSFPMV